jgi:hypothetical protein
MTDVMTVGEYPKNPLPGPTMPNTSYVWTDTPPMSMPNRPFVWHDINWLPPEPKNPILESPYFFPGNAWKGTSGMPQHRYV